VVARFLAPDLTQLAPAKLIEEIDAEAILAAQKAFVLARWAEVARSARTCRRSTRSAWKPSR
jgi:phage-related baseplate assembly protein